MCLLLLMQNSRLALAHVTPPAPLDSVGTQAICHGMQLIELVLHDQVKKQHMASSFPGITK